MAVGRKLPPFLSRTVVPPSHSISAHSPDIPQCFSPEESGRQTRKRLLPALASLRSLSALRTGSYDLAFCLAIGLSLVSIVCIWLAAPCRVRVVSGQIARLQTQRRLQGQVYARR